MKRAAKRYLSLLLALVMIFSCSVDAFATETKESRDSSVWTTEDFTYQSYEKLLYGCDYSRQFTVKGNVVSGFSESGEEKLKENTDLVIPALDNEGNMIVGVGQNAFYDKGLTSVTFPTGMMVNYEDTVTHMITKRGNFVIAENSFANNNLTSVYLPEGVIAVLPAAFQNNKIETVKLPKTVWWLETMSFAKNRIETVQFPPTCDFSLEMHGMAFVNNFIKSVRLPDFTEVVNKDIFAWNTGKEPLGNVSNENYKTYEIDGVTYNTGIVYMYTDNTALASKDRIHHTGKSTASQQSSVQKLVVNDGTEATKNPNQPWTIDDFIIEGTVIKGFSASGVAKRATNKHLILPDYNADGEAITEIAAAAAGGNGLFATETEGFDYVYLPNYLKKVGDFVFQNSGVKEVAFSAGLETIGMAAFQNNDLTSVILPDTVTSLGSGAFASNPKIERINFSKGLTEIPDGAFGCSDMKNWMSNLTSITLHEGITKIGNNAFAGNNFHDITLPSTVKSIGEYAFSTKNYLMDECTVTLNEGLETIGLRAFRNKCIKEITLPSTVTGLNANTFEKAYSDNTEVLITKVFVSTKEQYEDKTNFPVSEFHKIYQANAKMWAPEDFTYGEQQFETDDAAWVVTGFSESGQEKLDINKVLVIPSTDPDGKTIQGIADGAFKECGFISVVLPENVKTYIGAEAFKGNALTTLKVPEGICVIGDGAFEGNALTTVELPASLWKVGVAAFANNHISSLEFAKETDAAFQIEERAFAANKIKAIQLPDNTEKVHKWAFLHNTGMEAIADGTEEENKGGLVYMYLNAETAGADIACKSAGTSTVQEVFLGEIPTAQSPWGVNDFTYDESGKTITGLTESGKAKIMVNPELVFPKTGPTGEAIEALGNGETQQGIFVYLTEDKNYAPESVLLPDTLKKIGNFTFALNPLLTYEAEMTAIELPEGLEEIGISAFQNAKLTAIVLPDSVTTLGGGAFTGNGSLTSVTLSAGLKEIPAGAFNAGSSSEMKLSTLVIPEGIESIGANAFSGTHIESLTLPATLTKIGDNAFMNHQLTELEIPGSVKTIGSSAFRITQKTLKQSLETLVLNEGLVTIGQEAFTGNAITEVLLPSTVVLSAANSSEDCIFGNMRTPIDNPVVVKVSDKEKVDAFNTDYANQYSHVVVYDKFVGAGWIPEDFTYDEETGTLTGWSESGHEKRKELKTLILPDKTPGGTAIVAIGEAAFKIPDDEVVVTKFGIDSPEGMKSVELPKDVTIIGKEAFAQNAFTKVDLTGLTAIGEHAFYGNDLVEAIIPDTVISMGDGAFATNDIIEIRLSENVTKIPQGTFSMNIRLEHIDIPDTVTEIGATAFAGARLIELTIPKSVTKIGLKAFHLHHLTELTIPGNVKEVGESAFEGTFKATTLETLVIEEGVESIGKYAFKEALLETVHFPNSLKNVGFEPFLNNKGKDNSKVVEVTTNNYGHTLLEDDTYEVKFIGKTDIKEGEYYDIPARWAYLNQIAAGTSAITFSPDDTCTRAQVVTFLWRAKGCPEPETTNNPFTDVTENQYYYKPVLWAVENGITVGTSETTFSPDETVTRGQFVTFIWRAEGKTEVVIDNPFVDVAEEQYYYDAVLWAYENGITAGTTSTTFSPESGCMRKEVVTFLYRAYAE